MLFISILYTCIGFKSYTNTLFILCAKKSPLFIEEYISCKENDG